MKISKILFLLIFATISCKNKVEKTSETKTDTPITEVISEAITETDLLAKATEIHKRVLTVDTHNDINIKNFTNEINYTQELDNQVNLPKMKKGGLDVTWLIVYTGQGELTPKGYENAYNEAIAKFNAIHKLTNEIAPDQIELAVTPQEAININKTGKKVAMIGIENGYPIGTDINRVKEFYDLGARYMSLSHNGHSQLCDSNTGEEDNVWLHNGVSELGKEVIAEMNKWGMMIDVSHPSKESMRDMIELSKAPIIASHSSCRALCNHSRNLDDEQLMWLKENGGVVQTVAFSAYLDTEKNNKFKKTTDAILSEIAAGQDFEIISWSAYSKLDKEAKNTYYSKYLKIKKIAQPKIDEVTETLDPVNVSDFVDHIDYMVDKIGIEHVGISSDFDGGGGIKGWKDASETLNVTIELVKRGYTEEQIAMLWGGNLFRVMDEVQEVAQKIQNL
jgi:microsomal dipeptidase-like Zn-dependent dipeptidase